MQFWIKIFTVSIKPFHSLISLVPTSSIYIETSSVQYQKNRTQHNYYHNSFISVLAQVSVLLNCFYLLEPSISCFLSFTKQLSYSFNSYSHVRTAWSVRTSLWVLLASFSFRFFMSILIVSLFYLNSMNKLSLIDLIILCFILHHQINGIKVQLSWIFVLAVLLD